MVLSGFDSMQRSIPYPCLPAIWVIQNDDDTYELSLPKVFSPMLSHKIWRLSCGDFHWIALTDTDQLIASGYNSYGQLGTGDTTHYAIPVDITQAIRSSLSSHSVTNWMTTEISAGPTWTHILVQHNNGQCIFGWGNNQFGQVGSGSTDQILALPHFVSLVRHTSILIFHIFFFKPNDASGDHLTAIICGKNHCAALSKKRRLFCW